MSERRVKSAVMGGEGGSFLEGLLGKEKLAEDDEKEPPQSCNTHASHPSNVQPVRPPTVCILCYREALTTTYHQLAPRALWKAEGLAVQDLLLLGLATIGVVVQALLEDPSEVHGWKDFWRSDVAALEGGEEGQKEMSWRRSRADAADRDMECNMQSGSWAENQALR